MRFVTYGYENKEYVGVLTPDLEQVIPLSVLLPDTEGMDMVRFIEYCDAEVLEKISLALSEQEGKPLDQVLLYAPIIKPVHDILCVGVNYKDHLEETRSWVQSDEKAADSVYFSKRAVRILGPDENIVSRPDLDVALDYEVELAVIIGKRCRDVSAEEAEEVIFGYSLFNDLSARMLQQKHKQWMKGKSLDTLSAMGPVILTKDELPFPLEVDLYTYVNGEKRQHSNTRMLIKDVAAIISELSAGMTLEPGDIIATGTPAGVAIAMDPPRYLKAGDIVCMEIPEIGKLCNTVI